MMDINIPQDQWMRAILFIFLGIVIAVFFMGAHRSPTASKRTGLESARSLASTSNSPSGEYQSDKRDYP